MNPAIPLFLLKLVSAGHPQNETRITLDELSQKKLLSYRRSVATITPECFFKSGAVVLSSCLYVMGCEMTDPFGRMGSECATNRRCLHTRLRLDASSSIRTEQEPSVASSTGFRIAD